jgi:WD40-like Beta Propeller Repeat
VTRFRIVMLTAIAMFAVPEAAKATFPGQNGKIAFTRFDSTISQSQLWLANADGTGQTKIWTNSPGGAYWTADGSRLLTDGIYSWNPDGSNQTLIAPGGRPAPSPDGKKIAFTKVPPEGGNTELYVMNADGTGASRLTDDATFEEWPAWSPDGSEISFTSTEGDGTYEVFKMNPDGSGVVQLTSGGGLDKGGFRADWSPDGTKLVYMSNVEDGNFDIWTMNRDGSGKTNLTHAPHVPEHMPYWSPDGTKILYFKLVAGLGASLYTMNTDGTDQQQLIFDTTNNSAAWQPLPVPYVRPKGATPMYVSLVPAATACTAPNSSHGAPLAFGSCAPPVPTSPNLTPGVGDGSPAFSKSIGWLRMDVIVGSPGPPADSDLRVRTHISNVMNKADLSDYTGELQAQATVRITDRNGGVASTMTDIPLPFQVSCAATADTTTGGLCDTITSVNATIPGAAAEGERAVWALDQVRVFDGGPDGDISTPDNSLFEVQGVFVP